MKQPQAINTSSIRYTPSQPQRAPNQCPACTEALVELLAFGGLGLRIAK